MATSTLRALILAALVVLGIVGLTKLFPQNESLGITGAGAPGSKVSSSPSATASVSSTPTSRRKAKVKGVVVLVLNGTTRKGLAAEVSRTLANAGYKPKVPGNSKSTRRTIVYYRTDSLPEAQLFPRRAAEAGPLFHSQRRPGRDRTGRRLRGQLSLPVGALLWAGAHVGRGTTRAIQAIPDARDLPGLRWNPLGNRRPTRPDQAHTKGAVILREVRARGLMGSLFAGDDRADLARI